MAFTSRTLSASSGFGGAACGELITYKTADTLATVLAADYFGFPLRVLNVGDFIFVNASDTQAIIRITQINPSFTTELFSQVGGGPSYINWSTPDCTSSTFKNGTTIQVDGTVTDFIVTLFQTPATNIQLELGITRNGVGTDGDTTAIIIQNTDAPGRTYSGTLRSAIQPVLAGNGLIISQSIGLNDLNCSVGISVKFEA